MKKIKREFWFHYLPYEIRSLKDGLGFWSPALLKPQSRSLERFLYEGLALYRRNKWEPAVEVFFQAKKNFSSPWPAVFSGLALYKLKRYAAAVAEYDSAVKRGFDNATIYRLRAFACHAMKDTEGMIFSVEEAMKRSSNIGWICDLFEHRWSSEVDGLKPSPKTELLLEKVVGKSPRLSWGLVWRSDFICAPHFSLYKEGIEDLRKALKQEPSSAWIWAHLSRALGNAGSNQEALSCLNRAVELDPKCGWIYAWRGALRLRLRSGGALADLDKAVSLLPDYFLARAWRGQALRLAGRLREARSELELAVRADEDAEYIWGRAELCQVYQELGLWSAAAKIFCWVYERETKFSQAVLRDAQKTEDLERNLSRAMKKNPREFWIKAWRAWVLLNQKKFEQAARLLPERDLAKTGGFGFLVRAQAEAALGKARLAEKYFSAAARHSPTSIIFGMKGLYFYRRGNVERAIRDLSKSAEIRGTHSFLLNALAAAFLKKGLLKQASQHLERALAMNPQSAEALALRAEVRLRQGKTKAALEDLETAEKIQPQCPWNFIVRSKIPGSRHPADWYLRHADNYGQDLPGWVRTDIRKVLSSKQEDGVRVWENLILKSRGFAGWIPESGGVREPVERAKRSRKRA